MGSHKPGKKGYNKGGVRVVQTGKNGCIDLLRPLEEAADHAAVSVMENSSSSCA